jgi:hypothetical protein
MSLLLPKKYLSWSQLNCWTTNRDRYRREYFENSDKLDTHYMRYGKGIAKLIEAGEHKTLLPELVLYEKPEFKILTQIAGIPTLSFLDTYEPSKNVFREYKTGKHPWTQVKVQKHDQLVFYATALKWSVGKMPEFCDLDWIETVEDNGPAEQDFWRKGGKVIHVTGRIFSFHREFDERETERMEQLIIRTAQEISDAYVKYIEEI